MPGDSTYDPRFVQRIQDPSEGFLKTKGHSIHIGYSYPQLAAFITLYGTFHFFVSLAEIKLDVFHFEGYKFATDRSGYKRLNPELLTYPLGIEC